MFKIRYFNELAKNILNNLSNFTDSIKWHENVYLSILYTTYVIFFIAFTGLISLDPSYLITLENIIKYYISIILLIRFNPFVDRRVTKFDKRLVFSSALFLFVSTAAFSIAINYVKKLKQYSF